MKQKIITEEMKLKIEAMFEEQHRIFNDIFKCIDSINSQLCDIRTSNYKIAEKNKKEIPELSQDERAILRNIDRKYKWISRSTLGMLHLSEIEPHNDADYYNFVNNALNSIALTEFNHLFEFIKDGEWYEISKLLGE